MNKWLGTEREGRWMGINKRRKDQVIHASNLFSLQPNSYHLQGDVNRAIGVSRH